MVDDATNCKTPGLGLAAPVKALVESTIFLGLACVPWCLGSNSRLLNMGRSIDRY